MTLHVVRISRQPCWQNSLLRAAQVLHQSLAGHFIARRCCTTFASFIAACSSSVTSTMLWDYIVACSIGATWTILANYIDACRTGAASSKLARNIVACITDAASSIFAGSLPTTDESRVQKGVEDLSSLSAWTSEQFDPRLSWKDVAWVKNRWGGKLILKGIMDGGSVSLTTFCTMCEASLFAFLGTKILFRCMAPVKRRAKLMTDLFSGESKFVLFASKSRNTIEAISVQTSKSQRTWNCYLPTVEDAKIAAGTGADAIVVSNRQYLQQCPLSNWMLLALILRCAMGHCMPLATAAFLHQF